MKTTAKTYGNFFALLKQLPNLTKEDAVHIFTSGRTTSLKEVTTIEYAKMIGAMRRQVEQLQNKQTQKLDAARKRLIAAIGGYLKAQGKDGNNLPAIKAIALRATGNQYSGFNKIPLDRLNSLYAAFKNRKTDLLTVKEVDLTNPLEELQAMLEEAVADESYELAQKIHERIQELTK